MSAISLAVWVSFSSIASATKSRVALPGRKRLGLPHQRVGEIEGRFHDEQYLRLYGFRQANREIPRDPTRRAEAERAPAASRRANVTWMRYNLPMRMRIFVLAGFVLVALVTGRPAAAAELASTAGPAATPPPVRHVVVVSIDGMSPAAYLDPDGAGLAVPNLRRLVREGAAARGLVGVLPSVTYPSHTTLVTGVPPREHGILSNRIFDPEGTANGAWYWYAEEIRVPTLWSAAKAAGLSVGAISWPVTVGAPIDFLVPEIWRSGSSNPADLGLLRALATPGLVQAVERRLGRPLSWPMADADRTELALHILRTARPNLLLLHLAEHDHFQHEDGPGSAAAKAALERDDHELGRVRAALAELGLITSAPSRRLRSRLPTRTAVRPNVLLAREGSSPPTPPAK
jgi:hypothetical protein